MQVSPRNSEHGVAGRKAPDQVQHGSVTARARVPERPPQNRAQMVLELARLRALDRPVSGVVNARCHLVGDEPALRVEELDGQHAAILERAHYVPEPGFGLTL